MVWFHWIGIGIRDGKKRIIWTVLLVSTATVVAAVIGAAEGFWYFFTGGFSPLIGGYALVAAILLMVRVVGAALTAPVVRVDSEWDVS